MMQQSSLTNTISAEKPFAGSRDDAGEHIGEAEERTLDGRLLALERLLGSPLFKASERNRRFLKFVVEETVAGRADRIKAFTIAVDVFGRGADFDGAVDPIVRIAAGQLRKSLRDYYDGPGRNDPVEIGLPLGAYVPSFEVRSATEQTLKRLTKLLPPAGWLAATLFVMLCGSLAFLVFYDSSFAPQVSRNTPQRAVVVLDTPRTNSPDPGVQIFAQILTEALWVQMGRHDTVRLVGVRPEDDLGAVSTQARELFGNGPRLFQLLTTVQTDGEAMRIYWHLVDADTREAYYSAQFDKNVATATRTDVADSIAADMAASLFSRDGLLAPTGSDGKVLAKDLSE